MKFLLISCEDIQFNYDASSLSGKHLGFDRKSLDKHNEPVSSYENQWMLYFVTPQRKIIALHYINSLPSEYLIKFNYCKIKIIKSLNMRWYNYLFIPINFKILKYLYNSNMFFILKLIFLYDIFIFNNITRRSKIFNCIIS